MNLLPAYRSFTALAAPLIPFYLQQRKARGKEDATRIGERLGRPSVSRPAGQLLWLHAASVGEANSVQPLIAALRKSRPGLNLLLTTGTVTSAKLMKERLPAGVIHQYASVDTPQAAQGFVKHWQPDIAIFVESELWPNLLEATRASGCRMLLANARMSGRSFRKWKLFRPLIAQMLSCFETVFAQSENDAMRYRALGAKEVECLGNLKYDGDPLEADAEILLQLEHQVAGRPRWLAASIHPGEVETVATAHRDLSRSFPGLLTIVVPRHPEKGVAMAHNFAQAGCMTALRSRGQAAQLSTEIYIADTLGELGLFYRLCKPVFIGGSLIDHGGQNPLEPARLGCAILFGRHMFNFEDIADGLLAADAARQVTDASMLAENLKKLLADPQAMAGMSSRASAWVIGKSGVNERLLARILPLVDGLSRRAA